MLLRTAFLLHTLLAVELLYAQPGTLPNALEQGCDFPPPDSVDVTGDGVHDLVVYGVYGVSTCDIPVSVGMCHIMVSTLPGTQLLALLHPMVGHDVMGFAPGDTIPALNSIHPHNPSAPLNRVDRSVFMRGNIHALNWNYAVQGSASPQLAPGASRVFVFATTAGSEVRYGTFTLEVVPEKHPVRIVVGTLPVGLTPVFVQ